MDPCNGKLFLYRIILYWVLSPKFKRVLLNETPEFPFWGLYFCVDFDLRDSTKWRIWRTQIKKYFITKILVSTKLPNPIRNTRVLKLVFITIPCLKFWALKSQFCVGNPVYDQITRTLSEPITLFWLGGSSRIHLVTNYIKVPHTCVLKQSFLRTRGMLRFSFFLKNRKRNDGF